MLAPHLPPGNDGDKRGGVDHYARHRNCGGDIVSEEPNLDAYLARINYAGSIAPTLETLAALHLAHPGAIPFENLYPLMELPIRLQLSDIEQKLVFERRGDYCFEHNLLLKAVLEDMDFAVTPIAAGVLMGLEPGV